MKSVLRSGFTPNLDEFSKWIEQDEKHFRPNGELVHTFTRCGKTMEIYIADAIKVPHFADYVRRMEQFLLFYVDAASFLDCEDDDKWKFFVM